MSEEKRLPNGFEVHRMYKYLGGLGIATSNMTDTEKFHEREVIKELKSYMNTKVDLNYNIENHIKQRP